MKPVTLLNGSRIVAVIKEYSQEEGVCIGRDSDGAVWQWETVSVDSQGYCDSFSRIG